MGWKQIFPNRRIIYGMGIDFSELMNTDMDMIIHSID